MDSFIFSLITTNIIRICKKRVRWVERDGESFADCIGEDELIIGMMSSSILFNNINSFKELWNNWAPAIDIVYQVDLCKQQLCKPFFGYLDSSGKLLEYGYHPEDD